VHTRLTRGADAADINEEIAPRFCARPPRRHGGSCPSTVCAEHWAVVPATVCAKSQNLLEAPGSRNPPSCIEKKVKIIFSQKSAFEDLSSLLLCKRSMLAVFIIFFFFFFFVGGATLDRHHLPLLFFFFFLFAYLSGLRQGFLLVQQIDVLGVS